MAAKKKAVKSASKKATTKTAKTTKVQKEVKEQAPRETKRFTVLACINGEDHTVKTNDLHEAITNLKPLMVKTKVTFLIKDSKTKMKCERLLLLNAAKMMWRNKYALEAFVTRLIFTK
jgi:hypothetical protein